MAARIVDDPFGAVLYEEFEELEGLYMLETKGESNDNGYLVDLSPLFSRLFCESLVDHRHDLVEQLALRSARIRVHGICMYILIESGAGNLLHQRRGGPWAA